MPDRMSEHVHHMPERMSEYTRHIYFQMVCQKPCQNAVPGWRSLEESMLFLQASNLCTQIAKIPSPTHATSPRKWLLLSKLSKIRITVHDGPCLKWCWDIGISGCPGCPGCPVSQVVRPMFGSAASACAIFGNAFTTGWRMPCVDLDQTGMAFAKREFWGGYWWLLIEMGIDVGNEHGLTWQSFQSWFSRPDFIHFCTQPLEFRNHPGLGAHDGLEVLKTMRNSLLLLPSRDMVGWRVRPSVWVPGAWTWQGAAGNQVIRKGGNWYHKMG